MKSFLNIQWEEALEVQKQHGLPESQKEIVIALYQYFQMNAEQLSILLNYNLRTIYNMISRLRKQGWIRDVYNEPIR